MSVETHPSVERPEASGLHPETIKEIDAIGMEADEREVSPIASGVEAAANRVTQFLKERALNAAHGDAVKEYRSRDIADYTDHLAELTESQADDNIPMAERQQSFAQDKLNKENNRIDREETIDAAKSKLKGFGRSALSFLKGAGRISTAVGVTAFGVGLVGGVAAAKGVAHGANAVIDKGVQASAYIDHKVEAGYDAYDRTVQAVKDTAYEAKWRASGAVESAVDSAKAKASSLKFEAVQKIKEANPLPELRDEFNLAKAGASDLKFEAGMWKNAMLERAGAALKRKAERAKAFKERSVERFSDAREAARKRSKRIGHRALTNLAFAHESGQQFLDKVKASKEEEKLL